MHVVHLVDSSSRLGAGLAESVRGLAGALSKFGPRITVLAGQDRFSDADRANWAPLEVVNCPSQGLRDGIFGLALASKLDSLRPDLVHLHGIWGPGGRALTRWAARTGTPYVVSPHGMLDAWALHRSRLKKQVSAAIWERRLLDRASFLHALCSAEADAMRTFGLRGTIAVLPNGVEVAPPIAGTDRPSRPRSMLFLGRLHPKKGVEELVRAWAQLPPAVLDGWQLIVAGWDDSGMLDRLSGLAAENGLGTRIAFTGGVQGAAKDALLRAASAFILPSHSEGLPMALLEAWAHSLPVFMTAQCNLPEGFAAGAAFRISTDPVAMAATLALALPDTELLAAAGKAGRALVEERFAWDPIAKDMAERYAAAIG